MLRVLIIALLLTLGYHPSPLSASTFGAELQEVRQVVEAYFTAFWEAEQQLQIPSGFHDLFLPVASPNPTTLSEEEYLQLLLMYRSEQGIDLTLHPDSSYILSFIGIGPGTAEVRYSYDKGFTAAPRSRHQGSRNYLFTFARWQGELKIQKVFYQDFEGCQTWLNNLYRQAGYNYLKTVATLSRLLSTFEGTWQSRFEEILTPYSQLLLFRQGLSYAWLAGSNWPLESLVKMKPALAPVQVGSQVYLPLRVVVEALQGMVVWQEEEATIYAYLGDHSLSLNLSEAVYTLDGVAMAWEEAPLVISGRVMLPAKYLAQFLNRICYQDGSGLILLSEEPLPLERQMLLQQTVTKYFSERLAAELFP